MNVALVYDRVNKWGGAERVLLALHEIFPNAPLYTAVYSPEKAPWAKVFPKVYTSYLQNIPILKNKHELLGAFAPIAFETFNFDPYDLVISVTSEAAKGILTKHSTLHVCYCLTPTRYLWSHFNYYLNNPQSELKHFPFYKLVSTPFLSYAKTWDKIASQRPDVMVAISSEVKGRIKKYYDRESVVVYPPVDVENFTNLNSKIKLTRKILKLKDYYLVVSRLVPYKRVDLVIKAFNELGKSLVVVGVGSEMNRLKKLARDNIHFAGFVSEEELPGYYAGAKGFIFPQEEDFGITPVEAQAAGVPVIAYKKGGVLDTVIEGVTGVFFEEQTKNALIEAIFKYEKMKFDKKVIIKNAEKFSKKYFKTQFAGLIKRYC